MHTYAFKQSCVNDSHNEPDVPWLWVVPLYDGVDHRPDQVGGPTYSRVPIACLGGRGRGAAFQIPNPFSRVSYSYTSSYLLY